MFGNDKNESKEPETEAVIETKTEPKVETKRECPSENSPDGTHQIFHNEGTDERYCRFCGKPE